MNDDQVVDLVADVCEEILGKLITLPNGAAQIAAVRTVGMVIGKGLIADATDPLMALAVAEEIKKQYMELAEEMDQIAQQAVNGQLIVPEGDIKH